MKVVTPQINLRTKNAKSHPASLMKISVQYDTDAEKQPIVKVEAAEYLSNGYQSSSLALAFA